MLVVAYKQLVYINLVTMLTTIIREVKILMLMLVLPITFMVVIKKMAVTASIVRMTMRSIFVVRVDEILLVCRIKIKITQTQHVTKYNHSNNKCQSNK